MPSLKKKPSATVLVKRKGTKVVQKLNPFEVRINKKKHDVLGQKSKSDKGLPGVARSKAVKKRKKTLLVEYQQRNKTNEFVDRRFGEYNDDLTAEEKMMKRFTLERKRKHERSSLFTLNDDDEEGLTHYGRSIGGMEKFDHIELSENELEDEDIGDTHFGGFLRKKQKISETEDDVKPDRLRSRKEIMEEVVAKSKAMKYKQQSEKQDVEELLDKINTDWKSLQTTLPFASDGSKGQKLKTDDYDKTVRELAYEKRGQPTDRMKTEEEIAKEEKEKLEKREADRVRRMKGVIPSGDDMTTESADYIRDQPIVKKKVQFTLRYKDGKIVQEEGGPSVYEAVGRRGERRDPSDVGGESDSDEDCEGDDASDATGDGDVCEGGDVSDSSEGGDPGDEYGSDLESDVSDHESDIEEPNQPIIKGPSKAEIKKMKKLAFKELPYTFSVPKSLEELQAIVSNRSPEECLTAVERIHSCNHPSIDPGNKQKLQDFLPTFVDYCTSLGEQPTRDSLEALDKMARPLFKLSQLSPLNTAQVFQKKLQLCHQLWTISGGKRYPPLSEVFLLKLIAVVFPTSDFEHPITTPTLILMGQLLAKCAVKNVSDIVSGLLLCQLVIEYIGQSKRLMPELVNFLTSVVGYFAVDGTGICLPPLTGKVSHMSSLLSVEGGESIPTFLSLIIDASQPRAKNAGCCVLKTALSAISSIVALYSDLPSFSELVAPLLTNLQNAVKRSWPPSIEELLTETLELVCSKGSKDKNVLQLLTQKPKSIRFYEPKFDEIYEVNRKKARSKSVGERQKLKHKVKKETKGAIREIRRDVAFLAKEKLSERLQLDNERAAKTKKILHDLQMGQHEVKEERRKSRR